MNKIITFILALLIFSTSIMSCAASNEKNTDVVNSGNCKSEVINDPEENNALCSELPIVCASATNQEFDPESIYVTLEKSSYSTTDKIKITIVNKNNEVFDFFGTPIVQKFDCETKKWETLETGCVIPTIITTVISQSTDIYFDPQSMGDIMEDGTYRFVINLPNYYIVSPEFVLICE